MRAQARTIAELAANRLHRRVEVEGRSENVRLLLERIERFGWEAFIERLFAKRSTSPILESICVKLEKLAARNLMSREDPCLAKQ